MKLNMLEDRNLGFGRYDLGKKVRIRVLRDYGPYLDKPSLPAGVYDATLHSVGSSGAGFLIGNIYDKNYWYVQGKDVEVIG